ncbi:MAG TPA: hypothetical protein VLT33_39660, partial [Labilithrix sp.]|nr:hypothetical protein [Labilithrix sp.]
QGGYSRLLHGEAVAVGTVLELRATERLGLTAPGTAARAAALFGKLALPTQASRDDLEASWRFVLSDKKRAASNVKLPVVTRPGQGGVERIALDVLHDALLADSTP